MDKTQKQYKVFIYGTFKRNQFWHEKYIGSGDFLGNACTDNNYSLYVTDMPYLVKEASDAPVFGELFLVDLDTLYRLDAFFGHPLTFKRDFITVTLESGEKVEAHTHIFPRARISDRKLAWSKEYSYE